MVHVAEVEEVVVVEARGRGLELRDADGGELRVGPATRHKFGDKWLVRAASKGFGFFTLGQ